MEKKHELGRRAGVDAPIDGIAGVTLTAFQPARTLRAAATLRD
jgi:hypothetical protein